MFSLKNSTGMSTTPTLSVVMSVYNGADRLKKTIQSILDQSYSDLELIIINDGSTDQSLSVLQRAAEKDKRIKIINQTNQGLTKSLITGCELVSGKYIARHDVGDYSDSTRFEKQINYLEKNPDHVAVFTQFQVIDENNVVISQHKPPIGYTTSALDYTDGKIATPSHHGCVVFVKQAYLQVGGYRKEFYFAQDLDLWMRLAEIGEINVVDQILYQAYLSSDSISGKYQRLQKKYHNIIVESARIRAEKADETIVLNQASSIKPTTNSLLLNADKSSTLYFMASCLLSTQPELAKKYLQQAVRKNPLNLKAWYKLAFKTLGISD